MIKRLSLLLGVLLLLTVSSSAQIIVDFPGMNPENKNIQITRVLIRKEKLSFLLIDPLSGKLATLNYRLNDKNIPPYIKNPIPPCKPPYQCPPEHFNLTLTNPKDTAKIKNYYGKTTGIAFNRNFQLQGLGHYYCDSLFIQGKDLRFTRVFKRE